MGTSCSLLSTYQAQHGLDLIASVPLQLARSSRMNVLQEPISDLSGGAGQYDPRSTGPYSL